MPILRLYLIWGHRVGTASRIMLGMNRQLCMTYLSSLREFRYIGIGGQVCIFSCPYIHATPTIFWGQTHSIAPRCRNQMTSLYPQILKGSKCGLYPGMYQQRHSQSITGMHHFIKCQMFTYPRQPRPPSIS